MPDAIPLLPWRSGDLALAVDCAYLLVPAHGANDISSFFVTAVFTVHCKTIADKFLDYIGTVINRVDRARRRDDHVWGLQSVTRFLLHRRFCANFFRFRYFSVRVQREDPRLLVGLDN